MQKSDCWRGAVVTCGLLGALICTGRAQAAAPGEGPLIAIAPVVGIDRQAALISHNFLVEAFKKKFPGRVIDAELVVAAQKKAHVFPQALLTPEGVARLAQPLGAERALIVAATQRGVVVMVHAVIGAKPTAAIPVPGVVANKISAADARRIADLVARKAGRLLSAAGAEVDVALGEVAIDVAAASAPAEETVAIMESPTADILEEEQREQALAEARLDRRPRVPALAVAAGLGLGTRGVGISGSSSRQVVPVETGLLPSLSLYASACPLRLVPGLNHSPLADLVLDLHFRRGLYEAQYQGATIKVDDDDLVGRVSYRLPLWQHPLAPALGLGVGGGWERMEIGCCIATPSTRYVFAEAHGRIVQPLWPPLLSAEGLLAARSLTSPSTDVVLRPAWQGELWLVARMAPAFFARLGGRTAAFGSWSGADFALSDQRTSFELEVGGYF